MNRVELIGNVTKDIECVTSNSGISIANFCLAVKRRYPDKDGNPITDFHNCVAYRTKAETLSKFVKKGNKLLVAGELYYDTFNDAQGNKRIVAKITVEDFEFLTPKSVEQTNDPEFIPIDDDSLPF